MAIAVGALITGYSGANISGGTYTTPSYTFPADSLLICHLEIGHSVPSSTPTVHGLSGAGLAWQNTFPVQLDPAKWSGGSVWVTQTGPSGASGALTITFSAGTTANQGVQWAVVPITGHDSANPIRPTNKVANAGTSQFGTLTLPQTSLAAAGNRQFYFVTRIRNNNNILPAAGFTELVLMQQYSVGNELEIGWIPSGTYQQTAQPNFQVATANWEGVAYEVQVAPNLTALSDTDTGTFTETQSLNLPAADAGTFTEDASVFVAVSDMDHGTFTETQELALAFTDMDYGTFDETAIVASVPITQIDTGTFTEDAALMATTGDTDHGTFTETATVLASHADTDTGAFTEDAALVVLTEAPTDARADTDTGAFTESAALVAALTDTDHGAFTETAAVVDISDTPLPHDDTDHGAFTETASLVVYLTDTDQASLTDREIAYGDQTHQSLTDTDAGRFTETATVVAYLADVDTGTFTDTAQAAERKVDRDRGRFTESQAVDAQLADTDHGSFTETASVFELVRVVSDTDHGRFRDRVIGGTLTSGDGVTVTPMSDEDTGAFTETQSLVAWEAFRAVSDTDHGTFTETVSVHRGRPPGEPLPAPETVGSQLKVNLATGRVSLSANLGDDEIPLSQPLSVAARRRLDAFFDDPAVNGTPGDTREDDTFRYRYERRWPQPDVSVTGWFIVGWRPPGSTDGWRS